MEILRRNRGRRVYTDLRGNTVSGRYQRYDRNAKHNIYKTNKTTTLDIISLQNYGTPLLFWLIADFNDILDPMIDIPAGTELKIPILI